MQPLNIPRLISGGVITNYYCSSKCRHCSYSSSPSWEKKYMDEKTALRIFTTIKTMGCNMVHIGGGEPLLNLSALLKVLERAKKAGVGIEYIETNSSWYKDEASCRETLSELKKMGIQTLLISMDPFHNEYIPFDKVTGVMNACRKTGFSIFPWQEQFLGDITAFPGDRTHALEEYCEKFGSGYLRELAVRYRLSMKGRAWQTFKALFPRVNLNDLLAAGGGCAELTNTHHFHLDLFERFLPSLCGGLTIHRNDLGRPLDATKYSLLTVLYKDGVKGLLEIGRKHGFTPDEQYISKCDLCHEIRKYLVTQKGLEFQELQPIDYYCQ